MRAALAAWVCLAAALAAQASLAAPTAADGMPAAPSAPAASTAAAALIAVQDADPIELARVVQRYGDLAVRALLGRPVDVAPCLAAVRAAPFLQSPELALAALAELAAGRDSLLAPSAARAIFAIAAALDAAALARREHAPGELRAVRARLSAIAARDRVGADVRLLLAAAAEQLAAASVP